MPKWMKRSIELIRSWPGTFRIEQIRELVTKEKLRPRTHHQWGRLTSRLIVDGEIVPVGLSRASSRKTHRHRVGIYRRSK